jgi:hypothetical protein
VLGITDEGPRLSVTTRGDANVADETFTIERTAIVGRLLWRLRGIGAGVAWAGTTTARWAAGAVGAAVAALALARARRS